MGFRVNVGDGVDHYSQRNNKIDPLNSCQVTSMIGAAACMPKVWAQLKKSKNLAEYSKKYPQEEDAFKAFCLERGLNPEVHADLSRGFNDFAGFDATYFSAEARMDQLIADLLAGRACVISGTFPGFPKKREKGPLGHVVILCGAIWPGSIPEGVPLSWIIRDPYGDTMNNWAGSGKDIVLSRELFYSWMKPVGNTKVKWAHRFRVV